MKTAIMKSKHTIIAVALVLGCLILVDHPQWFQQVASAQAGLPAPGIACEKLKYHGDGAGALACYQKLSKSKDLFSQAEGLWGLRDYEGANTAFRETVKANPKDPTRLIRWGHEYLDHWQIGDAADLFMEALELDPNNADALMGLALVAGENYTSSAIEYAEKVLKVKPDMYEAHELMARVHLDDSNPAKAVEEANKALAISPEALEALSVLATVKMLDDQPGTEFIDRIFKVNKNYGNVYALAGHFFVNNRRYDEGINLYRKSLEVQPDLWPARAQLGVNLMRFGLEDEARTNLEACYNNGYKSQLVVNTLTLMDSYTKFNTVTTPTTILRLAKKEDELLRPYVQDQFNQALATYEKKYKHKLSGPVRLELYPDHADFEVRTMGMPGIGGILGVTFGKVVAMDSPSSRKAGEFHWASTMWHELSHVYVIDMTNGRVPRWFTEGEAVYEENATNPDWGDRMTPHEIAAIKGKKLLPVAELDRGFTHPDSPNQVVISYYQGGRIITYIVQKYGFDTILKMIDAFKQRKDTAEVIEEVLKITPKQFDAEFLPWLEASTKTTVDGFEDWKKGLLTLSDLVKEKEWDKVLSEGLKIRDIYPDYVEPGSVYEFLSQAYLAKGDKAKAIVELEKLAAEGGRDPRTLKQLADLQTEAGHKKEAVAALEKINNIFPQDEATHAKLGLLYQQINNPEGAIREFAAVLASGSVDKAGGHYNLAEAYRAAKKNDQALDEVYLALEAAPSFKPAQTLLRELTKPATNVLAK